MAGFAPLRNDLVIIEQMVDGKRSAIIKDPIKQKYYRYDEEEYYLLSLLDGERTSKQVALMVNRKFRMDLDAKEVRQFIHTVAIDDLFEKDEQEQNTFLLEQLREQRKSRIKQATGSFMYFRVPVVDPDQFFNRVIPYIRWFWNPSVVIFCVAFILSAIWVLASNSDAVAVDLAHTFDFANYSAGALLSLWCVLMGTIAIHEMGHGLTCKRFGGECHEIGLLFMLMTPCMYANVNDSWIFKNKAHRLYVVFAGCYVEILFGCCAVYLWYLTQPGSTINILAFQVVMVTFFSTLFMNLNPLMKFDGYFALSDLLDIPNLKQVSKEYVTYLINTTILRLDEEYDDLSRQRQWMLGGYGALSTLYMVNMKLGLLYMAGGYLISTFQLFGLIMLAGIAYKLYWGTWKNGYKLARRVMNEHAGFFERVPFRSIGVGVAICAVFVFVAIPLSVNLTVNAQLEPVQTAVIRTMTDGFVKGIDSDQMQFAKGDLIAEQENINLSADVADKSSEVQIKRASVRAALAAGNPTEIVRGRREEQQLQRDGEELVRQQHNLQMRAPFDGVLRESLARVENTYLKAGEQIGELIDPSVYRAVVAVPEVDFSEVKEGMNAVLTLQADPATIYTGTVTNISPVHEMKGATRHYSVTVTFPNDNSELREGMKGVVYLPIGKATGLRRAIRAVKRTVRLDLQM